MIRPIVSLFFLATVACATAVSSVTAAETPADLLKNSKRIVFLGDSITAAGRYVGDFDAWLEMQKLDSKPEVIDAGLPSETVSGLSEEGHAGREISAARPARTARSRAGPYQARPGHRLLRHQLRHLYAF